MATGTQSEPATDGDASQADVRREVLRDVFDALAPNSPWTSDDRFEHYPLDVQAIAQLSEDLCLERMKLKETELTKRLKQAHEKEVKCITQRCIKDKQAMKIEAEADKKAMGIEIARVKKRLIEVEREKHQATCQTAQSNRDARNLKSQLQAAECTMHELTATLKRKSEAMRDLERQYTKHRQDRDEETQKLRERTLNLEAMLNNQAAILIDKCNDVMKDAEQEMEKKTSVLRRKVVAECETSVALRLHSFEQMLSKALKSPEEGIRMVLDLRQTLQQSYTMLSKIQALFRDGATEDVCFMRSVLCEVKKDSQMTLKENERLLEQHRGVSKTLTDFGFSSINELIEDTRSARDLLKEAAVQNTEKGSKIQQLLKDMESRTAQAKEMCQLNALLRSESEEHQHKIDEVKSKLVASEQEKQALHERCDLLEHERTELEAQAHSVSDKLEQETRRCRQCDLDKKEIEADLQDARNNHATALMSLKDANEQDLLSFVTHLKQTFFAASDSVLESMTESMADATTYSCIRSLKLNTQIRNAGLSRRRLNSSIQATVMRIKNGVDALVMSADLEVILEKLNDTQTNQDMSLSEQQMPQHKVSGRAGELGKTTSELECCIFWLLLDARIMREQLVEAAQSTTKPSSNSVRQRNASTFSLNRLRTEKRMNEKSGMNQLQKTDTSIAETTKATEDDGLLRKSEAEEIVEIIEVLKEYLRHGSHVIANDCTA